MKYKDLRDFLSALEAQGELTRITAEVDPYLEITEICDRTLRAGGPALLFENVKGHDMPLLGNLFGTPKRVALGMGQDSVAALRVQVAEETVVPAAEREVRHRRRDPDVDPDVTRVRFVPELSRHRAALGEDARHVPVASLVHDPDRVVDVGRVHQA